jgi:UDP-glucose 4-epimerase
MATLITGAGLVGSSFAQCALKRGERVIFFDPQPRREFLHLKLGGGDFTLVHKDVRDLPALIEAMRAFQVDTVVHTAGLIGARVMESLYTGFQINVMGTINVAEAVRIAGVKRLVHISTFGVYDWRQDAPQPVGENFPRGSGRAYGNSKAAKELLLESYQKIFGFELIMLRLANVYGLGHFWSGDAGGEKMQNLLVSGLRGEIARIPQEQTLDFEYVYAKDVGRAVDLAATIPFPGKTIFNIGTGRITKFAEIVEMVKSFFPALRVEIIPGQAPESRSQHLDISRARNFLGWQPRFTMESALVDYIQDLKASSISS